jgi:hypothetical protein
MESFLTCPTRLRHKSLVRISLNVLQVPYWIENCAVGTIVTAIPGLSLLQLPFQLAFEHLDYIIAHSWKEFPGVERSTCCNVEVWDLGMGRYDPVLVWSNRVPKAVWVRGEFLPRTVTRRCGLHQQIRYSCGFSFLIQLPKSLVFTAAASSLSPSGTSCDQVCKFF